MRADLLAAARATEGFMPESEGLALYSAGLEAAATGAPMLEIGSYCGRSAVFLGAAAEETDNVLFSIDHHMGSEEHQPGEGYHDPRLVDPATGKVDTLPRFAGTLRRAGLRRYVLGIAADSATLAKLWQVPLGLVFIDGGHSSAAARADYEGWSSHLVDGGVLCIHDVFPDPADGGRPPYEIYVRALEDGFREMAVEGSLRVLRRQEG